MAWRSPGTVLAWQPADVWSLPAGRANESRRDRLRRDRLGAARAVGPAPRDHSTGAGHRPSRQRSTRADARRFAQWAGLSVDRRRRQRRWDLAPAFGARLDAGAPADHAAFSRVTIAALGAGKWRAGDG